MALDMFAQAENRRKQFAFDPHGRRWFFFVDKKSGDATTPFSPQFPAPWYPDQAAIRVDPERPGAVLIDYDGMIRARRDAAAEYRKWMLEAAGHFNVPNFDPDRDPPTAQMRQQIGKPPLSDVLPRAAKAGNGFILGLRPFDGDKPGDVQIAEALAREAAAERGVAVPVEDAEQFGDDEEYGVEPEPRLRPVKRKKKAEPVPAGD